MNDNDTREGGKGGWRREEGGRRKEEGGRRGEGGARRVRRKGGDLRPRQ
jgi:hypothetical protein